MTLTHLYVTRYQPLCLRKHANIFEIWYLNLPDIVCHNTMVIINGLELSSN